jgi:transglutaminase-like putative cysteine protease
MAVDTLGDLIATLGSIDHDEIDWQNIRQATVLIQQTFRYDYPGPITDLRQRLMVVPPDYHGHQHLTTHKLRVAGRNLECERSYDSFGNVVLDLSLEEVDGHVEFETWALVECHVPIDGGESADDIGFDRRFGEPSRLTRPDAPLRAVADDLRASDATGLDLAARVSTRVHDHFTYEWGVTTVETTAAAAWATARGVCQDYAHCMVALCRLLGLHARYVSGHLLGDGGTHAWVEVLLQDESGAVTAVPFDPTHDRRVGARYVTVAVGRDYGDVPPTSGTFEGPYPGELTTHKRAAVVRVEYVKPQRRRRVVSAN